jgi:hypothetical protein
MDKYSWEVKNPEEIDFIDRRMRDGSLWITSTNFRCLLGGRLDATVYGPDAYKVPVLLAQFRKDMATALHYQI